MEDLTENLEGELEERTRRDRETAEEAAGASLATTPNPVPERAVPSDELRYLRRIGRTLGEPSKAFGVANNRFLSCR